MACEDTVSHARSQRRIAANLAWEGALAGLGDTAAMARLLELAGSVPWPDVLAEANRLHLAYLLHLGIHSSPGLFATVPPPVVEALRGAGRLLSATLRVWQEMIDD